MTDFSQTIAVESDKFLRTLHHLDLSTDVPTCPDWNASDLLWHLTEVHTMWARILASGAQTDEEAESVETDLPPRPDGHDAMATLFREQTDTLIAELNSKRDADPAWFWLDTAQTAGAIRRMQAHEALMHRVDAELAAGLAPSPIDPALAADGIGHAPEVMWSWWGTVPGFEFVPVAGAVDLTASDIGITRRVQPGRWTGVGASGSSYDVPGVVPADSEPDPTEAAATAEVTGTAETLDLWLWGRGAEPGTSGDEASLAALREARNQGMQ